MADKEKEIIRKLRKLGERLDLVRNAKRVKKDNTFEPIRAIVQKKWEANRLSKRPRPKSSFGKEEGLGAHSLLKALSKSIQFKSDPNEGFVVVEHETTNFDSLIESALVQVDKHFFADAAVTPKTAISERLVSYCANKLMQSQPLLRSRRMEKGTEEKVIAAVRKSLARFHFSAKWQS